MTVRDDFDRLMTVWLDETAGAGMPDYLDETLDGIARLEQRPAWLSPGRWLPMQLTMPRVFIPRALPILAVIALLIAALIAAALIAGSQQRPLPPPFGQARTGLFVYDSGGDLFVVNPDGKGARPLVVGPAEQFGATFSRDGASVAYWATPPDSAPELWVSAADGEGARKVSGDLTGPPDEAGPAADWSPTGDKLAFVAKGQIQVVNLDGSDLHAVTTVPGAFGPAWSPDGTTIAFKAMAVGDAAVYVIDADGRNQRRVSKSPGDGLSHFWPSWSPDGTALLYHVTLGQESNIAVARSESGSWTEELIIDGASLDFWPEWSNDGKRISFHRAAPTDHGYIVIANADGSNERQLDSRLIGWAPHCWTPDDTAILAVTAEQNIAIGDEPEPGFVILDAEGTGGERFIPTPRRTGFAACSWQRLAGG